ncbi:unannotated protein [freshwater metagenome]|uniref:Unannotated protein n=1 Tax=freshwater metagenome TaxID=449393 RepID=A0A6J7KNN2_9ZZZZ|nr:hypothetical protein [Actinomycetota bacterium]
MSPTRRNHGPSVLAAALAVAAAASLAGAASAAPSVWTQQVPFGFGEPTIATGTSLSARGTYAGDFAPTAIVDSGRVWWVSGESGPSFTAVSRSLSGGPVRRVRLDVAKLAAPETTGRPFGALVLTGGLAVSGGRVVVAGRWITVPSRFESTESGGGVMAIFDGATGAVLGQRAVPTLPNGGDASTLLPYAPATARLTPAPNAPSTTWSLTDAVSGDPIPAGGEQAAGRYILGFTTDALRWSVGDGTAVVSDRHTGAELYRTDARAITRTAGARGKNSVAVTLQPSGALRVRITASRGLRPVTVGPKGAVRAAGRFQRYARVAITLPGEHRTFVALVGNTKANDARRRCTAVWMTNPSGTRGRNLTMPRARYGRQGAPTFWDDRTAVWSLSVAGRNANVEDSARVRVERRLATLTLRKNSTPACSSGG